MDREINSISNKKIKELKQLKQKKYRTMYSKFFIEGIRFVEDAILKKANISEVFYSENIYSTDRGKILIENLKNLGININLVSNAVFSEISDTVNTQGIIATIEFNENISEIIEGDFFLVLDRIQDPGNLGTIIRTADSGGIDGIFLIKGTSDIYNPKTLRSTMGSIFDMKFFHVSQDEMADIAKRNGIKIISTYLNTEKYYFDVEVSEKIAVVIGNEGNGISDEMIAVSDELVKIPIYGNAESLNAAIASAIIIYEYANRKFIK
jgi:TrmH family RNA methyltransferase